MSEPETLAPHLADRSVLVLPQGPGLQAFVQRIETVVMPFWRKIHGVDEGVIAWFNRANVGDVAELFKCTFVMLGPVERLWRYEDHAPPPPKIPDDPSVQKRDPLDRGAKT